MKKKKPFEKHSEITYAEYLRSDHWKDVKVRFRQSQSPQCCLVCGQEQYDLHHRTYKNMGHERMWDVVPLCRHHHFTLHRVAKMRGDDMWKLTRQFVKSYGNKMNGEPARTRRRPRSKRLQQLDADIAKASAEEASR